MCKDCKLSKIDSKIRRNVEGEEREKEEKKGEERPFIQHGSKIQSRWGLPFQEIFQDRIAYLRISEASDTTPR